jgi:hypothetical protein
MKGFFPVTFLLSSNKLKQIERENEEIKRKTKRKNTCDAPQFFFTFPFFQLKRKIKEHEENFLCASLSQNYKQNLNKLTKLQENKENITSGSRPKKKSSQVGTQLRSPTSALDQFSEKFFLPTTDLIQLFGHLSENSQLTHASFSLLPN